LPRYYRLIPALDYEHRAARYPGHTNIETTATWSKYPGRPWRESFWRSPNGHHAPCLHHPRRTRYLSGVARRLMLITDSLTGRSREPGMGSSSASKRATSTSLIAISFSLSASPCRPVSFRPKFTASCPAECHCGLHLSAGSSCSWPAWPIGNKQLQRVLRGASRRRRALAISTPYNACDPAILTPQNT
jgi:hypothetical protein